jgi:hypothetical protein
LANAIMTAPAVMPLVTRKKLALLIAKYLPKR